MSFEVRRFFVLSAVVVSVCCAYTVASAQQYILHDLGTLGGSNGRAEGINPGGQIVGFSGTTGNAANHAFMWTPTTPNAYTGSMIDLGTLGGTDSDAVSVNSSGWVTGDADTIVGDPTTSHAYIYNGSMHDLGTLGGRNSIGRSINDSGEVVGYSFTTGNAAQHAFLYDGTTMHDLGTLGGANSNAFGINDAGQVVGYSDTNLLDADHHVIVHAFMYDGTMHDLGTLGGNNSIAHAINNSGQITGEADLIPGNPHSDAFLWTPTTLNGTTGTMQDLGNIGGTSNGVAIDSSGLVLGESQVNGGASVNQTLLFRAGQQTIALDGMTDHPGGLSLLLLLSLNDIGDFVGSAKTGSSSSFPEHAVLVTPAPEPSTLALAALAGLSAWTLRRRS